MVTSNMCALRAKIIWCKTPAFLQLPRFAHGPGEHARGLGIAENLLVDRVPGDLPSDANGDVRDLADDIRSHGVVDVADRSPPAMDALDKVLLLAVADGQGDVVGPHGHAAGRLRVAG